MRQITEKNCITAHVHGRFHQVTLYSAPSKMNSYIYWLCVVQQMLY